MALLMGPPPACGLDCMAGWALAVGERSPPASPIAAGRGPCPIQWGAASPAEAIRAEPATVAAAHAGLCRSAAAIGDGLRCRVGALVRAGAGALVWAGIGALVWAGAGASVWAKAGVLVRAEDRDGLRCRAEARDTCGPSMWARTPRSAVTRMLAQAGPAASGMRTPRGSGRRDHREGARHARWVLRLTSLPHQAGIARGIRANDPE